MDYLDNYKLQIFCNKPSSESLMVYNADSGSKFDTSPNFINNDEITLAFSMKQQITCILAVSYLSVKTPLPKIIMLNIAV